MDERIDIEIKDDVSTEISTKILNISSAAKEGYNSLEQLKRQLKSLTSSGLSQLKTQLDGLNSAINKNALANEKLAQAQAKTAAAAAKAQVQQQLVSNAQAQRAAAAQRLAANQQLAAQKIAAAHANQAQRIAASQAISNQRLLTAQQQTNNTALRGQLVQQRLATAQNQTTAAASRASLAQQKLSNFINGTGSNANKTSTQLAGMAKQMLLIAGVTFSAEAAVRMSDAYTLMQNKLRVVAESETGLNTLTNEMLTVANRTRVGVEDTTSAFVRFDIAMKQLGGSQRETIRFTETINKALLLGGANTKEAASGLLQLSQAMNKGKLDGDEFRSVMELMPLVADAIAKKMKVARGELLNLAPQGKITGEVLRQAVADVGKEIDEKFAKRIPTIGESIEVLRNNVIRLFGEFNKKTNFFNDLAKGVLDLSNNLDKIIPTLQTIGSFIALYFTAKTIKFVADLTKEVLALNSAFGYLMVIYAGWKLGEWIDGFDLFGRHAKVALNETWKEAAKLKKELEDSGALKKYEEVMRKKYEGKSGITEDTFKGMFNFDYMGGDINKYREQITGLIKQYGTLKQEAKPGDGLRGTGIAAKVSDQKAIKEAERRATVIDKLKDRLNDELAAVKAVNSEEALEARIQKDINEVTNKKIKLTKDEIDFIREKETAIQASKETNASNQVLEDLEGQVEALRAIKAERYGIHKLNEIDASFQKKHLEFKGTARQKAESLIDEASTLRSINWNDKLIDSLNDELSALQMIKEESYVQFRINEKLNKAKKDGIELNEAEVRTLLEKIKAEKNAADLTEIKKQISEEYEAMKYLGNEREVNNELLEIERNLRRDKRSLQEQDIASIRSEIVELQKQKQVYSELQNIYNETKGAQEQLQYREEALYQAFSKNIITMDQYKMRFQQLAIEAANLRLQLGQGTIDDIALSTIGNYISGYTNMLDGLKNNFQSFFTALGDGFADSLGRAIVFSDNLGESLMRVGREAMATLISGLIKLGIQWALNMAVGKALSTAFMASQTAQSAAMAAATASAWAPAAAMVSLATMGMNAVGAMTGIGAATAMAQGLALTSLAGFKKGGYTGDKDSSAIAGVVHGREFVMNAQATAANRPALETMNAGGTLSPQMNVYIEHDGSTAVQATQIDESTVRIWARQESMNTLQNHGPHVIASDLNNPNSKTSKAISRNTESRRRR